MRLLGKIILGIVLGIVAIGLLALYLFFRMMKTVLESIEKDEQGSDTSETKPEPLESHAFQKLLDRTTKLTTDEIYNTNYWGNDNDRDFEWKIYKDPTTGKVTRIDIVLAIYYPKDRQEAWGFFSSYQKKLVGFYGRYFNMSLDDASLILKDLEGVVMWKGLYKPHIVRVVGAETQRPFTIIGDRKFQFTAMRNPTVPYLLFTYTEVL